MASLTPNLKVHFSVQTLDCMPASFCQINNTNLKRITFSAPDVRSFKPDDLSSLYVELLCLKSLGEVLNM